VERGHPRYYHAAAEEPVPPDFMDLMAQIAKQIKK
jgi:hypothetical protein